MRPFKLPPQILRLVLLTLAVVGSYLIARHFLVPSSFGEYGWYRANALELIASRPPLYAGKQSCDKCHADILQKLAADKHKTLTCEACHGVSREHIVNPNIPPDKATGSYCLRCHEANPSRPAWFKQIVVKDHYGADCASRHPPHQPTTTQ